MVNKSSLQLKLYKGDKADKSALGAAFMAPDGDRFAEITSLCAAFTKSTGWKLQFEPPAHSGTDLANSQSVNNDGILEWSAPLSAGDGTAPGHLKIHRLNIEPDGKPQSLDFRTRGNEVGGQTSANSNIGEPSRVVESESGFSDPTSPSGSSPSYDGSALTSNYRAIELPAAIELAEHLAVFIGQNLRQQQTDAVTDATRADVVEAVGSPGGSSAADLTARIDAILKGGTEALDCDAAAVYLLDESTTYLKLFGSWGLPTGHEVSGRRPLETALGDLEALVGQAVVLENPQLFELWAVPIDGYSAAVCVPVASSTTIMGTFWMFSEQQRQFSDKQTNLIEILAGRIALELEREMLVGVKRPDGLTPRK